ANAGRHPVYFAVTLDWSIQKDARTHARLEGLAQRIPSPGDTLAADLAPLERFVHERVPRAGLADHSQVLEPEMLAMMANYLSATWMLAVTEAQRGELAGALAALDVLDRNWPPDRTPPGFEQVRPVAAQMRKAAEAQLGGAH